MPHCSKIKRGPVSYGTNQLEPSTNTFFLRKLLILYKVMISSYFPCLRTKKKNTPSTIISQHKKTERERSRGSSASTTKAPGLMASSQHQGQSPLLWTLLPRPMPWMHWESSYDLCHHGHYNLIDSLLFELNQVPSHSRSSCIITLFQNFKPSIFYFFSTLSLLCLKCIQKMSQL